MKMDGGKMKKERVGGGISKGERVEG